MFDHFSPIFLKLSPPRKSGFFGPEPSKFGPFGLFLKSQPDRAFMAKKAGPSGFISGRAKPDPSLQVLKINGEKCKTLILLEFNLKYYQVY